MRRQVLPLAFALPLLVACAPPRPGSAPGVADLALTHLNVVDVERGRLLPDHMVVIASNVIVQVFPSSQTRITTGTQYPQHATDPGGGAQGALP